MKCIHERPVHTHSTRARPAKKKKHLCARTHTCIHNHPRAHVGTHTDTYVYTLNVAFLGKRFYANKYLLEFILDL